MAKLPEKIDDWTPPWEKKGEAFDADTAKDLIFTLMKSEEKLKSEKSTLSQEKTALATQVSDLEAKIADKPGEESAKDARITELTKQVKALEAGLPADKSYIEKLEVAIEVGGLTLRDAKRLVGEGRDELLEDARDLADRFAASSSERQQETTSPPPSQRPAPEGGYKNGAPGGGAGDVLSPEQLLKMDQGVATGPNIPHLTR